MIEEVAAAAAKAKMDTEMAAGLIHEEAATVKEVNPVFQVVDWRRKQKHRKQQQRK